MKKLFMTLLLIIAASTGLVIWHTKTSPPPPAQPVIDITQFLEGNNEGFAHTDKPWRFTFPKDHGAHPDYRTESWYFTGNLTTKQGRRFGFQLTFSRLALAPKPPPIDSAWATNQVYRSHFALTDVTARQFHASERFSRAALGLSGSRGAPVKVWLENWSMEAPAHTDNPGLFHLQAGEEDRHLDLQLHSNKPLVLSGNGSTGNSALPGGAFYYYAATRLSAQGTIQIRGESFPVQGLAWLDRAWGSVPLSQGQLALNRFMLQLNNGWELLCVQLRRRDGSAAPINTGLLVMEDGATRRFGRREVTIEVLDHWQSPRDNTRYPARWRLRIPGEKIELEIVPLVADQEMNFSIRTWGGAVQLTGTANGQPVGGNGYVELTGYADIN